MSLDVEVDINSLDALFKRLGDAADAAVRPAAQAGAQIVYDFARRNAPVSERAHYFYGQASKDAPKGEKKAAAYGPYQPGNLRDAIYQVYSKDNSGPHRAQYQVSFNFQKVPYGFMVEYGTSKAPARPFMRPAKAKLPAAQEAIKGELVRRIKEAL